VHRPKRTPMTETAPNEAEVRALPSENHSRRPLSEKLKALVAQLFKQFRIIRRALVHPKVPWHAKTVAGCAVLYVISPIQLIPNFIPVIGQLDDVVVVTLAIKFLRRSVPQSVLDECENVAPVPLKPTVPAAPIAGPLPNSRS
jgi:uncharacterized membrane protein YkvA (DUF1232 family)